jgi:hypothetical protein
MPEFVHHVPFAAVHLDIAISDDTPSPADLAWIRACARQLVAIDAMLDLHDAETIGAEMAQQPRWRSLPPDTAATSLILDLPRDSAHGDDDALAD